MSQSPEKDMCREFVSSLHDLLNYNQIVNPESFRFWHNDNGQRAGKDIRARKIAGAEAKSLGVMRGLYDYTFMWRTDEGVPFTGFMEAKAGDNDLSDEQQAFRAYCITEHIPNAVFYSVKEGLDMLQSWGVIKPTAIF